MTRDEEELAWYVNFTAIPLLDLTENQWDKLMKDVLVRLYGDDKSEVWFRKSDVGEAQHSVKSVLQSLADTNGAILAAKPKTERQDLRIPLGPSCRIKFDIEPDGRTTVGLIADDLRGLIAFQLSLLLNSEMISRRVLICDNRNCKKI